MERHLVHGFLASLSCHVTIDPSTFRNASQLIYIYICYLNLIWQVLWECWYDTNEMYIFECVYGLHNMKASNSIRKIFSFISNDFATNIFSQSRLFCCQLSFQEFVRPSSSSSYPVSRFSSPEPTLQDFSSSSPPPVSVSEGVSCSTPRTSRWSLTAKDFNTHIVHTAINLYVHS